MNSNPNSQPPRREIRAYISMLLAMLIIGFSLVFVKIALRHANVYDVIAHRFTIGFLSLLLVYARPGFSFPRYRRGDLRMLGVITFFFPLLFFTLQTLGLRYTSALEAGILSASLPILTLVGATLWLHERNTLLQIAGIVVSVAGIAYIFYHNGLSFSSGSFKGNVLILLAVMANTIYFLLVRKVNGRFKALDVTFFTIGASTVVFNVVALSIHAAQGNLSNFLQPLRQPEFIGAVLFLGVLSTFYTSFANNYALTKISASQVAVFSNLSPVFSVIGGALILHERLQAYHILGGLLVMAGIMATMWPNAGKR